MVGLQPWAWRFVLVDADDRNSLINASREFMHALFLTLAFERSRRCPTVRRHGGVAHRSSRNRLAMMCETARVADRRGSDTGDGLLIIYGMDQLQPLGKPQRRRRRMSSGVRRSFGMLPVDLYGSTLFEPGKIVETISANLLIPRPPGPLGQENDGPVLHVVRSRLLVCCAHALRTSIGEWTPHPLGRPEVEVSQPPHARGNLQCPHAEREQARVN